MARRGDVVTRAEAVLALVAAALVVAGLVALAFRHTVAVGVALAAVAVAGGCAWTAISRRGAARRAAAVAGIVALAIGAVALVVADAFPELALLVLAGVVFMRAARTPLRRQWEGDVAERHVVRRARSTPSRAGVILLNPRSGDGKGERLDLAHEARRRGIEVVVLGPRDDLRKLAHEAARRTDVIGMAGGDGSQALVAEVAVERGVEFVCIPAGTRNHLAHDLGIDRDDAVGALDAFVGDEVVLVDLPTVNGRVFVNNVSLGVYAAVVQSDAYRGGKWATFEELAPTLLGPDARPFDLRFRTPDGRQRLTAQLVLVSNNPYVFDRIGGLGSRPRLDTGMLGILAIEIAGAKQAAELAAWNEIGEPYRFRGFHQWAAEEFEVDSGDEVAAGIDGEATVLAPPLRFTTAAGALAVRLPPGAGPAPAAASPNLRRSALRDLWRSAAGR